MEASTDPYLDLLIATANGDVRSEKPRDSADVFLHLPDGTVRCVTAATWALESRGLMQRTGIDWTPTSSGRTVLDDFLVERQ